jgi:hypothetical protein
MGGERPGAGTATPTTIKPDTSMNASTKACEQCLSQRVSIGKRFYELSPWRRYGGAILIYLPLFVSLPFVLLGAGVLYAHLRVLGGQNIKGYREFVPNWSSHRYRNLTQQITMKMDSTAPWVNSKLFWMFNCNFYCPLSVGLYEWSTYLVKMVENFWCPFFHDHKATHAEAAIDQSYWHIKPENRELLTPEDRDCSIWNEDAAR